MKSHDVLAALERGPLRRGPQHAWLYEVRNGTGYTRKPRTADALVFSCWPSRGIWLAGVEVKVNRGDWLRELDDPAKSESVQRYCDYWWVAAPTGVVEIAEVPETWGYYEVAGGKVHQRRAAPRLEAQPLDRPMLASLFRNWSEQINAAERRGAARQHEELTGSDAETKLANLRAQYEEAKTEKSRAEQQAAFAARDFAQLRDEVKAFERSVGMEPGELARYRWNGSDRCFKLAQVLARRDLTSIAAEMRAAADALDVLAVKGAAE